MTSNTVELRNFEEKNLKEIFSLKSSLLNKLPVVLVHTRTQVLTYNRRAITHFQIEIHPYLIDMGHRFLKLDSGILQNDRQFPWNIQS
jgi:hypothetical protein